MYECDIVWTSVHSTEITRTSSRVVDGVEVSLVERLKSLPCATSTHCILSGSGLLHPQVSCFLCPTFLTSILTTNTKASERVCVRA